MHVNHWTQLLTLVLVTTFTTSCTQSVNDKDTTLNVHVRANLKTLDPINISSEFDARAAHNIFDTLLQYHYLKRPLQLIPNLAESMPIVSKDGLTHTLKIKKGTLFHDNAAFKEGKGREVTTQDIVYSWKRLADPKNRSENFWIFEGKIKGLDDWRKKLKEGKASYDTLVEGLQTPDKYTLIIKLNQPYYQMHYMLAHMGSAVVPHEAIKKYGKDFTNNPVSSGPFMFSKWIRGSKLIMKRNPKWRGESYPTKGAPGDKEKGLLKDANKPIPFVEQLIIHEFNEDQPRYLNFLKGNLDISEIPKDSFDQTISKGDLKPEMKQKGIKLYKVPTPDLTFVALNQKDKLFKNNIHLRRAIAMACDTKSLIEKFYNGRALKAQGIIPPTINGFNSFYKSPYRKCDFEKAKQELKKAGYPGGKGLPEIEHSVYSGTTARQFAEFYKANLAKIGIKVKIVQTSWPQFVTKIKNQQSQSFEMAWVADYPDAENFLQLLYGPKHSPGPNHSNYSNPKYDQLYEKALKLPPGPKRMKLYIQMRDIASSELPIIPQAHRVIYYLNHSWLHNYKKSIVITNLYKYMRIDPKERAKRKPDL